MKQNIPPRLHRNNKFKKKNRYTRNNFLLTMSALVNITNLWQIVPSKIDFFKPGIQIYEPLNYLELNKIINSKWDVLYDKQWLLEHPGAPKSAIAHLKKLRNNIFKKKLRTSFNIPKFKGIGRMYYKRSVSLGPLVKRLRHGLTAEKYIDFDMDACHHRVMVQICKAQNVPEKEYETLQFYCENKEQREGVLQEIMKRHFGDSEDLISDKKKRELAKELMIRVFFLGDYDNWIKDYKEFIINETKLKRVSNLKIELEGLSKYIIDNNPKFYALLKSIPDKDGNTKTHKQLQRSITSHFTQHYERLIVESILKTLNKMGIKTYVYCFDGFMLLKEDVEEYGINEDMLEELTMKYFKFDITWSIKKTDEYTQFWNEVEAANSEKLEVPDYAEHQLEKEYLNFATYEEIKEYFELFVCSITNPAPHNIHTRNHAYFDDEDTKMTEVARFQRSITQWSDAELIRAYKDIKCKNIYAEWDDDDDEKDNNGKKDKKKKKYIKFVLRWLNDASRRQYKQVDFIPANKPFKKLSQKGLSFNLFCGYPDFLFEELKGFNEKEEQRILKPFLDMVYDLVGGENYKYDGYFSTEDKAKAFKKKRDKVDFDYLSDDNFNTFMHLIAMKIQYPNDKASLPYCIVLMSNQGEGKNFTLNTVALIIGEQHYFSTEKIEDITGTHAEGIHGNLIINLDEISYHSSKNYSEVLKHLISEDYTILNAKNQRPTKVKNRALIVCTTNHKTDPVSIDFTTGDRRYFVFLGNGITHEGDEKFWINLAKLQKDKHFLKHLYNYLCRLDVKNFNFREALANNHAKKPYRNIVEKGVPAEWFFMRDIIVHAIEYVDDGQRKKKPIYQKLVDLEASNEKLKNDHNIWDLNKTNLEFYDHKGFTKPCEIPNIMLAKCYKLYTYNDDEKFKKINNDPKKNESQKLGREMIKKLESFKSLHKPAKKGTGNKNRVSWVFTPYELLKELHRKGAFNEDEYIGFSFKHIEKKIKKEEAEKEKKKRANKEDITNYVKKEE